MPTHTTYILGEDGKAHTGEVVRRMGGTLMLTDCKMPALRPLGINETWWHNFNERICNECMEEVKK